VIKEKCLFFVVAQTMKVMNVYMKTSLRVTTANVKVSVPVEEVEEVEEGAVVEEAVAIQNQRRRPHPSHLSVTTLMLIPLV
jgi:hypothetical protein